MSFQAMVVWRVSPHGNKLQTIPSSAIYIGVSAQRTPLGNQLGVMLGGDVASQKFPHHNSFTSNHIASNLVRGIQIGYEVGDIPLENSLSCNAIYDNGMMGLDIFPIDPNEPNDKGDGDEGANHLQNFPVLTQVSTTGRATN